MLTRPRCIGTTVTTVAALSGLLGGAVAAPPPSTAAAAVEQGWWNAARRACREAGDAADGASPEQAWPRMSDVDRLEDGAFAVAAARQAWLRDPQAWQVRWSRQLLDVREPARRRSVEPAAAGPVIAWETAGGVHAVLATTGGAAWRDEPTLDTTLFPRRGGRPRPPTPDVGLMAVGHMVYAGLAADGVPVLACLDCSAAAQGRVAWATDMPDGIGSFAGPPAADAGVCAVVCRPTDDRAALMLVVCDARDGRVLWRRRCGATAARDGGEQGRGRHIPFLHEDLVIVADHAGSVTAFTRSGRPAWTYRYTPAPLRRRPAWTAAAAIAAARDTLLVAPDDHPGLFALDDVGVAATPPRRRWETTTGGRIVGATPTRVVIVTDVEPRLRSLAVADGTPATTAADGATVAAILAGDVVVRAARGDDGVAITPLDAATLRPLAAPFSLGRRAETDVALAIGRSALVVATPGMLSCIAPQPPAPSSLP